jgi:hypothetical protein
MIADMTTQHQLIEEEVERLLKFSEDKNQVDFYLKQLNTRQQYIPTPVRKMDEKSKQGLLLFKYETELSDTKNKLGRLSLCSECYHLKSSHCSYVCICGIRREFHEGGSWYPKCSCKRFKLDKSKPLSCGFCCGCKQYKPIKNIKIKQDKIIKYILLLKEKIKDLKK